MKITFLGTGTSTGIPMIGCNCRVCTSVDPHDRRRRTSIYLETTRTAIVVDTPPDFREQALAYRIPRIDAILFTHSHADHIFGFDDIRRFNTMQDAVIPAYASPEVTSDLKRIFSYIGTDRTPGVYRPRIDFIPVTDTFTVGDLTITPLPVLHGSGHTQGFLFENDGRRFGYVPDCREMPESVVSALAGIDLMVLDALRYRPHATHLTVDQSLALLARIGAKRSAIIHMCHELDHASTAAAVAGRADVTYDGLTLQV